MEGTQLTIQHSEQMGELAEALAQAQSRMSNPAFDSTNPHFRARYTSLAAARDAVLPHLTACGIAVTQLLVTDLEHQVGGCTTTLWHKSGQFLSHTLLLPIGKADIQGYGSAFTYARRYSLMAIAGVAGEEELDGEDIVDHAASPKAQTANGTYPKASPQTDTSTAIWRETLRVQLPALAAPWPDLGQKSLQTLRGLTKAIQDAQSDPFFPDSRGLALADAALQWADKLEDQANRREVINAGIPDSN